LEKGKRKGDEASGKRRFKGMDLGKKNDFT